MERIRFNISTWDEGRKFMNDIGQKFKVKVVEKNGDLFLENHDVSISCHFDDREFSFILIKLVNEEIKADILNIKSKYV